MIIAAIIIGIILIFLVFLTFYISKRNDGKFDEGVTLGLIVMLLFFTEAILITCFNCDPRPTAMDVYQGKTTLEYKVVDDVKVDSVVIFKNNITGLNIYE